MLFARAQAPSAALRGLVIGALASLLVAAAGADTNPPVIQHSPISVVDPGSVSVDFTVSDQSALFGVIFHWRFTGEGTYKQVEFPDKLTTFHVALEVKRDFEFWIEAYDEFGNGPALDGTADRPNRVHVTQPTPPPETTLPTPAENPAAAIPAALVAPPPPPPPPPQPFFPPGPFVSDRAGRVQAARNIPAMRLEARVAGDFYFGDDFILPGTSMVGGAGRFSLAFAPVDWLGLRAENSFGGTNLSTTVANATTAFPLSANSLDDWTFSARLALPHSLGPLRLALEPSLAIPANDWCQPTATAGGAIQSKCATGSFAVSPGVLALVSVEVPHFRAHLNVGYLWDNSANVATHTSGGATTSVRPTSFDTFALGISQYDDLKIALAAELPSGIFDPFIEWELDLPVDRDHFAGCSPATVNGEAKACAPAPAAFPAALWQTPDRIDIGFRIDLTSTMALDARFELSLTEAGNGLVVPAQNATTAQGAKTAEPIPLPGVVLPPPYLFNLTYAWQFDLAPKAKVSGKAADDPFADTSRRAAAPAPPASPNPSPATAAPAAAPSTAPSEMP